MNSYEEFFAGAQPRRRTQSQLRLVKSEREAPMVLRGAEKAVAEETAQLRRYKRALAHQRDLILSGPHGADVRRLLNFFRSMTIDDGPELLELLESLRWFVGADQDTRFLVLGLIDEAVRRVRVRHGLPPFDDALPGEADTVFQICRANLGGLTP